MATQLSDLAKGEICPQCLSNDVAFVLMGYPADTDEVREALETGKIVLGGCKVTSTSPMFHCNACGYEWGVNPLAWGRKR